MGSDEMIPFEMEAMRNPPDQPQGGLGRGRIFPGCEDNDRKLTRTTSQTDKPGCVLAVSHCVCWRKRERRGKGTEEEE